MSSKLPPPQPAVRGANRFSTFALGVLGLNVLVVLWGALVRATGSGAGCGNHWPLCNGVVIPQTPAIQTIIEFTHRITSALALVAVIGLCVWCFRLFPRGRQVRIAAVFSVAFLLAEALLGAGLVLFRYVGENATVGRAAYLSAHLTNTLLLLSSLTATTWLARNSAIQFRWRLVPTLLRLGLFATVIVSVTGAVAALGDTLFPSPTLSAGLRQDFTGTSHFLLRLRVFHPILAIATGIFIGVVTLRILRRLGGGSAARTLSIAILLLVTAQLWAGAVNLTLLAPVWMQLVHLLLADALWVGLTLLSLELGLERHAGFSPLKAGRRTVRH